MTLAEQLDSAVNGIDGEWTAARVQLEIDALPLAYDREGTATAAAQPRRAIALETRLVVDVAGAGRFRFHMPQPKLPAVRSALSRLDAAGVAGTVTLDGVTRPAEPFPPDAESEPVPAVADGRVAAHRDTGGAFSW